MIELVNNATMRLQNINTANIPSFASFPLHRTLLTTVAPQFAIFGGPAPPPHQCPGRSLRRWRRDHRASATSPCAEEEAPARATVKLPRHSAAMRAASLHPTLPLVIHSPLPTVESFVVPRAPRPVDRSAFGRTAGAASPLLIWGGIHTRPPPPSVS
jgi:hypothetical protein